MPLGQAARDLLALGERQLLPGAMARRRAHAAPTRDEPMHLRDTAIHREADLSERLPRVIASPNVINFRLTIPSIPTRRHLTLR